MRALASTLCIAVLSAAGCGIKYMPATHAGKPSDTLYIDDPIILDGTNLIPPSEIKNNIMHFDLKRVDFENGGYDDIEVSYFTSRTSDADMQIYNFRKKSWECIVKNPNMFTVSREGRTLQGHSLYARRIELGDVISRKGELLIWTKAEIENSGLRALKINPDYYALPVTLGYSEYLEWRAAHDGRNLWISWANRIRKLTPAGDILDDLTLESYMQAHHAPIACDQDDLWLGSGLRLYKLNAEGEVLDFFDIEGDILSGIAYIALGNDGLWVALNDSAGFDSEKLGRIIRIDPTASCSSKLGVVLDTLETAGAQCSGLAWSGKPLLAVLDGALGEYTRDGELIDTIPLPVRRTEDIFWDGESLWILHRGIEGSAGNDPVISRFRLH